MAKISERNDYIDDELARELFDVEEGDELPDGRVRVCNGEWVRIPGGYYFDPDAGPLHPEVSGGDVPVEALLRQADNHIQDLRGGVYENGLLGETRGMGDRLTLPARSIAMIEKLVAALASAPPPAVPDAVVWWNGCDKTVPEALRFLAERDRPSGGDQRFNSAHLYQLASEIERMAGKPLYAFPAIEPTPSPDPQARNAGSDTELLSRCYLAMRDAMQVISPHEGLGFKHSGILNALAQARVDIENRRAALRAKPEAQAIVGKEAQS